jgi:8-oxo-dGTP pyrophosphatase MutT (NUDIX family)
MAETSASRPASTILLLRDGAAREIEVFMMVRHHQIEFNSGALVFPGGSVDAGDNEIVARADLYSGGEGLSESDRGFRIAAIRETFEESGILLARSKDTGTPIDARRAGELADKHRVALNEHKISFLSILADNGLQLALDTLVPYAHWITPEGMPKRFDTWFFLAAAPPDQLGAHDGRESTDLIRLAKQGSVDAALEHARGMSIVTVMPVMTKTETGRQLRIPREAGYDGEVFEVGAVG